MENFVERGLRQIDGEFDSGVMDAFGNMNEQEEIMKKVRNITQLQSQIFRRCMQYTAQSKEEQHSFFSGSDGGHQAPNSFERMSKSFNKKEQPIGNINTALQKLGKNVEAINDRVKADTVRRLETLNDDPTAGAN
eukprot:TRINITY_DN45343_c0_g1_i1.p1 TRINITY_DN45343_c0_g1~~TRINITY_DN45343_c0_g1_i1.p1  ORF type:complete len:135 (+),score=19.67 TRINITY_DN45343_c0_g1_i1:20-424(+)